MRERTRAVHPPVALSPVYQALRAALNPAPRRCGFLLAAGLAGVAPAAFGQRFPASLDLSTLDGSNGFVINGVAADDSSGFSVSDAGNIDGDGFADVIIGAPNVGNDLGSAYVVFGGSTVGSGGSFELSMLDGSNGFQIENVGAQHQGDTLYLLLGYSVSAAGDINGDGFDDVVAAAAFTDRYNNYAGAALVVFGGDQDFPASFEHTSVDGSNGFFLRAGRMMDAVVSVSAAGDVNGDGFDDLIIGTIAGTHPFLDATYVVFGGPGVGSLGNFHLHNVDGSNGFVVEGAEDDRLGSSVSTAGDVNGDGFADVIIGAPDASPNGTHSGASYVVFGAPGVGSVGSVPLSSLDGSNGFVVNGVAAYDNSGRSVSAGDVNGDGFADLLIGAYGSDLNGNNAGASYVVFGGDQGFPPSLELSSLDGGNGFVLVGVAANDRSGFSVDVVADINGDEIADLVIGAPGHPAGAPGKTYVVFGGSALGSSGTFELSSLDGSNGFVIEGAGANDMSGRSVSGAGDFNGDTVGDIVIGALSASPNGDRSGASYIVFGMAVKTNLPSCTVHAMPRTLWPPNHKLVNVTTSVKVKNAPPGPDGFELVSVTSNEPNGGGKGSDVPGDIRGWTLNTPDTSGWLRAERSGPGGGRVYTLTYRTKNGAGDSALCSATVTVPRSPGK